MNVKHLYSLICFSLLVSNTVVSQNFSVSGKLTDLQKNPIAYANIVLLSTPDSLAVTGTSSLETGLFSIKNIAPNNYVLKISFVGFKDVMLPISVTNSELTLEAITMEEVAEALNEVALIAKKPTLKKEVDRLVFNVANTALSEGNMADVLKNTPSVLILNNSLTVRNATPTVYINDRKIHLTDAELLQLLEGTPANSIKSVEVITNPPAKYDADAGVVLNIIMSKNLATGYNGTVFGNYTQGTYARYDAGISNFYKTKKINLFASYNYQDAKVARASDENVNFKDNLGVTERLFSDFDRTTWSQTHTLNTNLDYFINDTHTIGFSANLLYVPEFKYITKGSSEVFNATYNKLYDFNNINNSNDDKYNLGFDLDYDINFESGSSLSFNTHLTTYDYHRDQHVRSTYFNSNNAFDFLNLFNTTSDQNTLINTGQMDYSLPLSETASFAAGAKVSFIKTDSKLNQFNLNSALSVFDSANSNAFKYNESIYAAYASFDKSWEKWQLSFGLRVEQTDTKGKDFSSSITNKQDYFDWFPTANISYQVSKKINIYTNFKRSIERPDFQSLNPFKFYLNDNTIVTGNPNLQPAITNHAVIGVSLNESFFVEAYYKDIESSFTELPLQDNVNNLLVFTPTNLVKTVDFGFDFVAIFDVLPNWNVYAVTSFLNWSDKATINNMLLERDTWSNYSVLSNDFTFLEDNSLTANFSLVYISEYQQGFQTIDTRLISDLTLKKTILNNRGALTLAFADLFNTQDYTVTSRYLNQDNSRFLNQDNRYIKLGFSYKFGNTGLNTNQRTNDLDERNRLEKSN
ncbi:outer membrane beta-barrel family protein [Bizionia sediminis]|uniref:Outer membrane beta-barrel family protein n=1 Tax=Bizionia sediminis TaxID=1737064 RepID=A0ABW5KR43_9FLAO